MKKHDEHYAKMKIQPQDIMEQRATPGEGMSNEENLRVTQALKYVLRAGHKDGQPWKKDIEKAINYLTRALTGEWIGELEPRKEIKIIDEQRNCKASLL